MPESRTSSDTPSRIRRILHGLSPHTRSLMFIALTGVSGGGCVGHLGGDSGDGTGSRSTVGLVPWQRLTNEQYDNTIRDLLGNDARLASKKLSPEGQGTSGFLTTGLVGTLDVGRFADVAHTLALAATPALVTGKLLPCDPASGEASCAEAFIRTFGKRAFRRPLDASEIADFVSLYQSARAQDSEDFVGALRLVVEAMLETPAFLYLDEPIGETTAVDGRIALSPFELASRLSYFLWNTMPDETLFLAAEQGALTTDADVRAQAQRMLADARAKDAIESFHTQWLGLDRVTNLQKQDPMFTEAVKASAAAETRRFVEYVILEGDARLETLLAAPFSFVNADLAPFYGMTAQGSELSKRDLVNRWGILTQVSVLATTSSASEQSPIYRGKLIREKLLCNRLPAPPANVPPLAAPTPGATIRDRYQEHASVSPCKDCHVSMDPIGFGLGNYDAVGKWATKDPQGRDIDVTGTVYAIDGNDASYEGPKALIQMLVGSKQVQSCVTKKWLRFALGRAETDEDQLSVDRIGQTFDASGHNLRELMLAIAESPSFRFRPQD